MPTYPYGKHWLHALTGWHTYLSICKHWLHALTGWHTYLTICQGLDAYSDRLTHLSIHMARIGCLLWQTDTPTYPYGKDWLHALTGWHTYLSILQELATCSDRLTHLPNHMARTGFMLWQADAPTNMARTGCIIWQAEVMCESFTYLHLINVMILILSTSNRIPTRGQ